MSDLLKEAASSSPNQIALFTKESATFSQLDEKADRLAALLSPYISTGDRIAALLPNSADFIALFFASLRVKAALCPLNTRLPPNQIKECIKRLSPALFISSFDAPFEKLPSISDPSPPSLLLFTSGTTGSPKIAAHSLSNLLANASAAVSFLDLRANDQWLLSLPLFHVGGIGILFRCILARAAICLSETDTLTHISYVPTQLYRKKPTSKKLRCLLLGGAPIPSIPTDLPVYLSYGLTEMGSLVAASFKSYHLSPLQQMQLAPDGEILVKGASLFQGYWENGKLHLPLDDNGWFKTSDIGAMENGKLTYVARKDRQFISGGENIQPEEIEKELLKLPHVVDAFVKPTNDPEFGARPVAFIQTTNPHFTLKQMQEALLPHLPKYKIPIALTLCNPISRSGLKDSF
ncbi:MAG: hypothetical protein A3E80_03960 [Chlamydiae bacterium RIFCSPHIGHO2_12_FULL_49_9]|nr:MAG: hypothetical protein A3E80_03960 [Chlamydiae bacterium RIFCSPHIGHO2_12_FULL_49_9]